MKIPEEAPTLGHFIEKDGITSKIVQYGTPYDLKGRYLHWEEIKRHTPPAGLTNFEWWGAIKFARLGRSKDLPFFDKQQKPFKVSDPDGVLRDTNWLTQHASGAIWGDMATAGKSLQQTLYIHSLFDEAISSSQLEGATTTRRKAKEMLSSNRKPSDRSEWMILNNYLAMVYIEKNRDKELSPGMVMELHSILTDKTLDTKDGDKDGAGRFRRKEEHIAVYADDPTTPIFEPPASSELPERMVRLCDFANTDEGAYIDPLHKAIILHFMLAYDHPFVDGNGRTARALFYWYALKSGFGIAQYLSISGTIKKAPKKYGRSFLHVETDENDLTYFLIHQLDVIKTEVTGIFEKIKRAQKKAHEAEELLESSPTLRSRLNGRQIRLLRHGLKNWNHAYTIQEHSRRSGISHGSARIDLLALSDKLGLFEKKKRSKAWIFLAPENLNDRIQNWEE